MDEYIPMMTDEERAARHAARAKARKKKLQQQRIRRLKQTLPIFTVVFLLMGVLSAWATSYAAGKTEVQEEASGQSAAVLTAMAREPAAEPPAPVFTAARSADTVTLGEDLPSKHAIVIDVADGKILAEKDAHSVLSPASMTKILTLLVACEHLSEADLEKTVTITREITDYCYVNDCSVVGLMVDETVPVRELLYGTILSSGADAALGLANFVAGSHEAFVGMMNEKLEELGLSDTAHFTNCVGLYHEDHHCSVYDMAVILESAMENPLCREVLDARIYKTLPTSDHPEGQDLSNWFLRRIEDKDTGGIQVIGAKTGYVNQAGNCAASCGKAPDGKLYLCVTADAQGPWRAIYDHVELYQRFCGQ